MPASFHSPTEDNTQPFTVLLPGGHAPQALLLLIAYLCLFPLIILGAKPVLLPLLNSVEQILANRFTMPPFYYWLRLLAFVVLGFGVLVWLRLRLSVLYVSHWATLSPRPHPLHVDYHPAEPYSFYALGRWVLYRVLRIATLTVFALIGMAVLGLLQFLLLNALFDTWFMRLPLFHILTIFLQLALGLFLFITLLKGCWQAVGTTYGEMAVITEPMRSLPVLFNRCNRLLGHTPQLWLLVLVRALSWFAWLGLALFIGWHYDMASIGTFSFPWFTALLSTAVLGLVDVFLGYMKWSLYHKALERFYTALPHYIRHSFKPPASLFEDDYTEDASTHKRGGGSSQ